MIPPPSALLRSLRFKCRNLPLDSCAAAMRTLYFLSFFIVLVLLEGIGTNKGLLAAVAEEFVGWHFS